MFVQILDRLTITMKRTQFFFIYEKIPRRETAIANIFVSLSPFLLYFEENVVSN